MDNSKITRMFVYCKSCKQEVVIFFEKERLIVWDSMEETGTSGIEYEFNCPLCKYKEDIDMEV